MWAIILSFSNHFRSLRFLFVLCDNYWRLPIIRNYWKKVVGFLMATLAQHLEVGKPFVTQPFVSQVVNLQFAPTFAFLATIIRLM